MNNRIDKFIELATFIEHSHGAFGEHEAYDKLNVEKFAELIVKECLDIAYKIDKNPYIPDGDQARAITRKIKEHFGVT